MLPLVLSPRKRTPKMKSYSPLIPLFIYLFFLFFFFHIAGCSSQLIYISFRVCFFHIHIRLHFKTHPVIFILVPELQRRQNNRIAKQ